jgi:hypothetical protein
MFFFAPHPYERIQEVVNGFAGVANVFLRYRVA